MLKKLSLTYLLLMSFLNAMDFEPQPLEKYHTPYVPESNQESSDPEKRRFDRIKSVSPILQTLLMYNECNVNKNTCATHTLLRPLFWHKDQKYSAEPVIDGTDALRWFIEKFNSECEKTKHMPISPQTAIQIQKDYKSAAFNRCATSRTMAYVPTQEEKHFTSIIESFPAALKVAPDKYSNYDVCHLAYIAYWLQTDAYEKLLLNGATGGKTNYVEYLTQHLKRVAVIHNIFNPIDVENTVNAFITIFGPITHCKKQLIRRIKDCNVDTNLFFQEVINQNATALKRTLQEKSSHALDFATITTQLQKGLPSCCACTNLFSEDFDDTEGGKRLLKASCDHIICDTCTETKDIFNTSCKHCQRPINAKPCTFYATTQKTDTAS